MKLRTRRALNINGKKGVVNLFLSGWTMSDLARQFTVSQVVIQDAIREGFAQTLRVLDEPASSKETT